MSYHDITSWSESAYPSSQYTNFNDWIRDIINDFNNSGHYLPEQILAELQEHWLREYGVLDLESIEDDDEDATRAEEQQQEEFKEQVENLPSKEEFKGDVQLRRQIREAKRRTGIAKRRAKGKRARKRRSS